MNIRGLENGSKFRDANVLSGIYRARVEGVNDPSRCGRVQVRVPALHGFPDDEGGVSSSDLPWASLLCMSAGFNYGSLVVPEVGEYVMIVFEDSDPYKPVVLGSLYGSGSVEPKSYGSNSEEDPEWKSLKGTSEIPSEGNSEFPTNKILYKSPTGALISVDDTVGNESVLIQDAVGQSIKLSSNLTSKNNKGPNAEKESGESTIEITGRGGQKVSFLSDDEKSSVRISYPTDSDIVLDVGDSGVTLEADKYHISIGKDGSIDIIGDSINIKSDSGIKVSSDDSIVMNANKGIKLGSPAILVD